MSCFDKDIADKLWQAWQKQIIVYVDAMPSKDRKYVNIRKIMTPQENADYEEANRQYDNFKKPEPIKPQDLGKSNEERFSKIIGEPKFNPTSMYVSYAKDIFIALVQPNCTDFNIIAPEEGMEAAINLIKQAHKEFS